MLQKRHYPVILLSVLLAFVLAGCATFGAPDDPPELVQKKAYYAALKEFTLTAEKYNQYYAKADEATQAKWKEEISPWFIKGNEALKIWKTAVYSAEDPASQEAAYLAIKSQLLILLVEVFGEKEG